VEFFGDAIEGGAEAGEVERFYEVVVHARLEAALAVGFHGVGGERDDGEARAGVGFFLGTDDGRGGEAVHFGHLQVHEHDVEFFAADVVDGLRAVLGEDGFVAEALKDGGGEATVEGVVFGDEHTEAARGQSGLSGRCGGRLVQRVGGRGGEADARDEGRALRELALRFERAAHEFAEAA